MRYSNKLVGTYCDTARAGWARRDKPSSGVRETRQRPTSGKESALTYLSSSGYDTFLIKLDSVSLLTIMLRLSARKLSACVVLPPETVKAILMPTSRSAV